MMARPTLPVATYKTTICLLTVNLVINRQILMGQIFWTRNRYLENIIGSRDHHFRVF